MRRLILFDIDGTLLRSAGAGRRAMERALTRVFGSSGDADYHYDGKTDCQIVRELMRQEGHDDAGIDARMDDLTARYLAGLRRELADGSGAEPLPGIPALLDAIEPRADAVLGLLTGNLADGAAVKLGAAGIDMARFRVNAFGSDSEHRPLLPAVAQERARAVLGHAVQGSDVVIIGDTPFDIDCGRGIGARAVAVATGRYGVDELRAHAPAAVFADLTDTPAVLDALFAA